jgi:hypothetical protein
LPRHVPIWPQQLLEFVSADDCSRVIQEAADDLCLRWTEYDTGTGPAKDAVCSDCGGDRCVLGHSLEEVLRLVDQLRVVGRQQRPVLGEAERIRGTAICFDQQQSRHSCSSECGSKGGLLGPADQFDPETSEPLHQR